MVKGWKVVVAVACLVLTTTAGVRAEDDSLRADLDQALQEIKQLRSELAEVKEQASWRYQEDLTEALKEVPAASQDSTGGFLIPAGWTIKPYGYIKLDVIYDDSAGPGGGDVFFMASPENDTTRSDNQIAVTARQSRLGMIITAPKIGEADVRAVVEADFYGPLSAPLSENQGSLRFRRAFGEVKAKDWSFLFGQEWEIVNPLFPHVLNYMFGAFAGNPGYRQPQARFTKWFDFDNDSKLTMQTALTRQINQDLDGFGVDDGIDAKAYTAQGRISYACPVFVESKPMTFGVSGHYGVEEVDWDHLGDDDDIHTWSLNADLKLPITNELAFHGEMYWAENFNGSKGCLQPVNTNTRDEVEAMGGWAQFVYKPAETPWTFVGGWGMDDPIDADIAAGPSQNMMTWVNGSYAFSKYLSTGLEVAYYETRYKGDDMGDNVRVQHSWILKF